MEQEIDWTVARIREIAASADPAIFKAPRVAPLCPPGTAILVRMSDKIERLQALAGRFDAKESFNDAILDLAVCCVLYMALSHACSRQDSPS